MATRGIQAPSPAIFQSDPLEQTFAKGVSSNEGGNAGINYMMMTGAGATRERNQDIYAGQLDKSNAAAQMLARMEEAFKYKAEMSKLSADLIGKGALASGTAGGMDISGGNTAALDAFARLKQAFIQSEIAKNQSQAANARGAKTSVEFQRGPSGEGGVVIIKGESPQAVDALNQSWGKLPSAKSPAMSQREAAELLTRTRQPTAN